MTPEIGYPFLISGACVWGGGTVTSLSNGEFVGGTEALLR